MTDTQWPRYMVLRQEKPGKPHEHVGTVHAPDAELALLNARDVFVRRPDCFSLWLVRVDHILAKTAEELRSDLSWTKTLPDAASPAETYHVFQKRVEKGNFLHTGTVEATTPAHALKRAIETYQDNQSLVWWVFPARFVLESAPEDMLVMFAPALDKSYFRDQAAFHTSTLMKQIKDRRMAQQGAEDDGS